jgi:hypothetical protein
VTQETQQREPGDSAGRVAVVTAAARSLVRVAAGDTARVTA